jgi:regulator of RNase E activity RraA
MLTYAELLELKRWNTPTIYNGWEQITNLNPGSDGFNIESTTDYMPQMGPMIGYAVTLRIEPGNPKHRHEKSTAWKDYRQYIASIPGPKIVVVQDLDKPSTYGSFWGEVNANVHRALGCVGTITDGAIRDLDEMYNAGFKAIARRLCVGHAFSTPIAWGLEVEVFGRKIKPGHLIHADKHGFLVIPEEDENQILDAARFMDSNECKTVIKAARDGWNLSLKDRLASIETAAKSFRLATREKFKKGNDTPEW